MQKTRACNFIVLFYIGFLQIGVNYADTEDLRSQVVSLQRRLDKLEKSQSDEAYDLRKEELIQRMIAESQQGNSSAEDTSVTAGYDKGFFIKSRDDQFRLDVNSLMQFRYLYQRYNDGKHDTNREGIEHPGENVIDPNKTYFELSRAEIELSGHVQDAIQYQMLLQNDIEEGDKMRMREYEVAHNFTPEFGLKAGRLKEPFGVQSNVSDGHTQAIDRALATEVFKLGRGTGIEAFGMLGQSETHVTYRAGVFNDFNDEEAEPFANNDNSPSFATRVGVLPNNATPDDFVNESDLEHHENPVSQFGASYGFADDRNEQDVAGGDSSNYRVLARNRGLPIPVYLGGRCNIVGLDAVYKHQGFSFHSELFLQHTHFNDSYTFTDEFGSDRDEYGIRNKRITNEGWFAQAGYFVVPKKFEVFGRLGGHLCTGQ